MKRLSIGMLLFLLFASSLISCAEESSRPNVIIITLDALRPDRLSLYGYQKLTSPNLDSFSEKAFVFTNAFTVSPSTPPSMASLMTSKYPYWKPPMESWAGRPEIHHGLMRFFVEDEPRKGMPSSVVTLAEILRDNGYITGAIITNPYLKKEFNFHQGFQYYEQFRPEYWRYYPKAEQVIDKALSWLSGKGGRPFFLFIHIMDIHAPYEAPPPFNRYFEANYVEDEGDREVSARFVTTKDTEERKVLLEHNNAMYDNCIRYVDEHLGRLFDFLKDVEMFDNSIIVVHSDHGDEFLEHGDCHHKGTVYEEVIRIPLIVNYRFIAQRETKLDALVRQMDIMPTILDILGIEPPYALDGKSMLPLMRGESDKLVDAIFGTFHTKFFVRTRNWKWIYDENTKKTELYNLATDRGEQVNIYESNRAKAEDFHKLALEYIAQIEKEDRESNSSKVIGAKQESVTSTTIEQLKSLGYLQN